MPRPARLRVFKDEDAVNVIRHHHPLVQFQIPKVAWEVEPARRGDTPRAFLNEQRLTPGTAYGDEVHPWRRIGILGESSVLPYRPLVHRSEYRGHRGRGMPRPYAQVEYVAKSMKRCT